MGRWGKALVSIASCIKQLKGRTGHRVAGMKALSITKLPKGDWKQALDKGKEQGNQSTDAHPARKNPSQSHPRAENSSWHPFPSLGHPPELSQPLMHP